MHSVQEKLLVIGHIKQRIILIAQCAAGDFSRDLFT